MRILAAILFVLSLSTSCIAQDDHEKDIKAAVKAAEKWLSLVDNGEYARSWEESARFFQTNMTQEIWEKALTGFLPGFGEMKQRKVSKSSYLTKMPGGPDGEYVMIRFETDYANKKAAIETVTPKKEEDGKWRVCGYFIK